MPRSSEFVKARAVARQRQAEADEPQRLREQAELDLATDFEVARIHRDDAVEKVAAAEVEMGRAIEALAAMNSLDRVVVLTGEKEPEIKRLRKLAESAASSTTHAESLRSIPHNQAKPLAGNADILSDDKNTSTQAKPNTA